MIHLFVILIFLFKYDNGKTISKRYLNAYYLRYTNILELLKT